MNEGHKYDVMGVMKMDDENIVELFWQRSEKALSKTRIKYARYCYAIAFRILHNSEDAEECVNDTLLRVWDAIPPARPNMLRIFLGKITRNLSLNYSDKMSLSTNKARIGVLTTLPSIMIGIKIWLKVKE